MSTGCWQGRSREYGEEKAQDEARLRQDTCRNQEPGPSKAVNMVKGVWRTILLGAMVGTVYACGAYADSILRAVKGVGWLQWSPPSL